jgi:glutaredoxin
VNELRVYGTGWCGDVARTRRRLDKLGVDYQYIDIDEDIAGEAKVIGWNDGKRRVPTLELLVMGEVRLISVPSDSELESELRSSGFLTASE